MKRIVFILIVIPFTFIVLAQVSYNVSNKLIVSNKDCELSKLVLVLPVPESNQYQTISNLKISEGQIITVENTGNKYLRDINTSSLPGKGSSYTLSCDFDVTLYPMTVDRSQFQTIYSYDTSSDIYKKYTVSDGEYINVNNGIIKAKADILWKESNENYLDYAYACYLYVAENFNYLNPNTGLHPIADLLAAGGGDCGNLASIYINLLRAKGIPAKHIITVRPDGSYHVWADFYLEKYGWIPVDVNMKLDYPNGNYFGYCKGDGIVMSVDICNNMEIETNNYYNGVILQTYYYWYWYASKGSILLNHQVESLKY